MIKNTKKLTTLTTSVKPNDPNILLDLQKDIDFFIPKNDIQQLDILIDTIQNPPYSSYLFLLSKSKKIFLENSHFNKSLKGRFQLKRNHDVEYLVKPLTVQ